MNSVSAVARFLRDKRGYEHYYLVSPPRRGQARRRILYWFRTPPNVKVGREPFGEDVQRLVESQNPGVTFNWASLLDVAVQPPEPEQWRERRRERAAARRAIGDEEAGAAGADESARAEGAVGRDEQTASEGSVARESGSIPAAGHIPAAEPGGRRRRRRRRRRGSGEAGGSDTESSAGAAAGSSPASDQAESADEADE